jgi:hypothetical protein
MGTPVHADPLLRRPSRQVCGRGRRPTWGWFTQEQVNRRQSGSFGADKNEQA